jgi:hypothetical protein
MKRPALLLAALGAFAAFAPAAHAGIVILKNGKVFIGVIDPEGVTDDKITMKSPRLYKGAPPVRGTQDFPRYEVRWHDVNADEPTDDYFKLYENETLDQRYTVFAQRWKERQDNSMPIALPIMPSVSKTGSLSAISIPVSWGSDAISMRKPTGWTVNKVNDILILESDQKGTEGFVPRIHVYSVESAVGQVSDQVTWVKQELEKLASTADGFELKSENTAPKMNAKGGYDVEWITSTRRNSRTIRAMRQMHFRDHRTYFVTCYAHEKDFEDLNLLFHACMSSLAINEAGTPGAAGSDNIDVTGVGIGQTYRWKSASVPDQVVWEVKIKDTTAVRSQATVSAPDGSKKTSEVVESTAPCDPVTRMTVYAGTGANPQKVGTETITVSGTAFDCAVYEASGSGKKYKLWLSKKFPIEVKLVADGAVVKELAEIKTPDNKPAEAPEKK